VVVVRLMDRGFRFHGAVYWLSGVGIFVLWPLVSLCSRSRVGGSSTVGR